MRQHFAGIAMLVALMPWSAAAGQAPQRLSLRDAIGMALENNHLVKAAKFNADAARQG